MPRWLLPACLWKRRRVPRRRAPSRRGGAACDRRRCRSASRRTPQNTRLTRSPIESRRSRPRPAEPSAHVPVAPSAVWDAVDSPGRPLADHERPQGLGADLSPVRVHTGGRAARSARMLDAAAYTFGDDIVLGDDVDTRCAAGGCWRTDSARRPAAQQPVAGDRAPGRASWVRRPPARRGHVAASGLVWVGIRPGSPAGSPVPGIRLPYTEADRPKLRLELEKRLAVNDSGPPPSLPASFPR